MLKEMKTFRITLTHFNEKEREKRENSRTKKRL
jgi:hypothetical protein